MMLSDPIVGRARAAALNAHAPYSRFHVGCVVETRGGEAFTGCNMENASYGLSMCAEVGALTAATAAGKLADIVRITVAGGHVMSGALAGGDIVTPCGRCRQLISEAAALSGTDIIVTSASGDGATTRAQPISVLLPGAFGPAVLGHAEPLAAG